MPAQISGAGSVRIVIVEDEALLAEELEHRLQRMSMDVVGIASSAELAIALTANLNPDVVLMDVRLRGPMDGIAAAAVIREKTDVPVVYLTAHSDDETLHRAQVTGPFGYLVKPIRDDDLRAAIATALQRSSGERRLREARDDLTRSNEALREFTSLASHDLRAPLFNITGLVDLLREDGEFSADQEECLQRIRSTATRMSALLESLLGMARLQAPAVSSVDLKTTIHDVLGDLHRVITDSGATVCVGALPVVDGDRAQLHRLFLNLIGNALKFRRADVPPRVIVDVVATNGHAGHVPHVTIAVQDNGVGFPPDRADQLFKPFRRLHNASQFDGTGLGLAACAKIVALHHGSISAHSAGTGGAVFTVRLPVHQPMLPPAAGRS